MSWHGFQLEWFSDYLSGVADDTVVGPYQRNRWIHRGHIFAIIETSNHVENLYVVLNPSEKKDREICLADGIKPMPAEVRLSWIGEVISKLENIHILHLQDDTWSESDNWDEGTRAVKDAIDGLFESRKP